jgi:hypothetical protein
MSGLDGFDGEAGAVEVRVYRDGTLVHTELCESEDDAALVVEQWSEQPRVTCEVDDLSVRHRAGDIAEPEPPVTDVDYPTAFE